MIVNEKHEYDEYEYIVRDYDDTATVVKSRTLVCLIVNICHFRHTCILKRFEGRGGVRLRS